VRLTQAALLAGEFHGGSELSQRRPVAQHDAPRRRQRDQRHFLQLRERARHCLDREPEIVRNILASHRQIDAVPATEAISHLDEKGCNALLGALHHQHDVVARALEFAAGEDPKLPRDVVLLGSERDEGA